MRKFKLVALAVTAAVALTATAATAASTRFTDVPADHLFASSIEWLGANGITKGCNPPANTKFCPEDNVTRGEMAAFLKRFAGTIQGGQGLQGAQGPQGPKGDKGATGAQGVQGPKGDKGDQGIQGLAGAAGQDGTNGTDGANGLPGAQGIQGEKGDKGDKGEKGDQGLPGQDGANGLPGAQGIQGEKGEKGDKGDKGDTGAQGIQGPAGPAGPAGTTTVFSQSTGRNPSSGTNGTDDKTATANCPANTVVVGGGVELIGSDALHLTYSKPNGTTGWTGKASEVELLDTGNWAIQVWAICASNPS